VELNEAIEWYETREPGLGLDFATQVHAAVQRALAFPFAWQEMAAISGAHWCIVFPTVSCMLQNLTGY
jgi:hypothetical protein